MSCGACCSTRHRPRRFAQQRSRLAAPQAAHHEERDENQDVGARARELVGASKRVSRVTGGSRYYQCRVGMAQLWGGGRRNSSARPRRPKKKRDESDGDSVAAVLQSAQHAIEERRARSLLHSFSKLVDAQCTQGECAQEGSSKKTSRSIDMRVVVRRPRSLYGSVCAASARGSGCIDPHRLPSSAAAPGLGAFCAAFEPDTRETRVRRDTHTNVLPSSSRARYNPSGSKHNSATQN